MDEARADIIVAGAVVLDTLLDRLGPFTLDPAAEPPHIEGMAFRSPLSLPVVFPAGG